MIHFDLSTHIYRPLNQVFAFVVKPENDFQWQYGTLASTQLSHGEIGTGTLFRAVGHLMGRRVETVYEVTVFELNNKYGFKSVSGPLTSFLLYTFEMAGGGTKINLATETNPRDAFKPGDIIVVKKLKKEYKENLAMLKNILEGDPTAKM
jgi:hypothetical protein